MFIQKLKLQQFRCFSNKTFSFEKPFVLIEGKNGSGKTTILEALHYGCFFKSFRTTRTKDLISFDKKHFFIQVDFKEKLGDLNQIQVGVSFEEGPQKRLVKFNKKVIKSYRDIISHYRIVSLAEEDLQLVQGAPEHRRYFLNQLLVLSNPNILTHLKKYKQILEHRNKMLVNTPYFSSSAQEEYKVWTKQLWEQTILIQKERICDLRLLESEINNLLAKYFSSLQLCISFEYQAKQEHYKEFDDFWKKYQEKKFADECKWRRSLFGAHLDDFSIVFQKKKARHFASRGQQKLVVFLIKVALAQKLEERGLQGCLLLDDFLTDFDHERLNDCLSLLTKLSCQVFVTCPLQSLVLDHYKGDKDQIQTIKV